MAKDIDPDKLHYLTDDEDDDQPGTDFLEPHFQAHQFRGAHPYRLSININGENPCPKFYSSASIACKFLIEENLYSEILLIIRLQIKVEPGMLKDGEPKCFFQFLVHIPVTSITNFKYLDAQRSEHFPDPFCTCEGKNHDSFCNSTLWSHHNDKPGETSRALGLLEFTCDMALVECRQPIPQFINGEVTKIGSFLLDTFNQQGSKNIMMVLDRPKKNSLLDLCRKFEGVIAKDRDENPVLKWINDSPVEYELNLANILDSYPLISMQRERVIFPNPELYKVTMTYAIFQEQEYDDAIKSEFKGDVFEVKAVEFPESRTGYGSEPSMYLMFVRTEGHIQQPLQDNDRAIFHLKLPRPEPKCYMPPIDLYTAEMHLEDRDDDIAALHSEEDSLRFAAVKCDSASFLCPDGYTPFIVLRPLEPNWTGPPEQHPWVGTEVPAIVPDFANTAQLLQKIKGSSSFRLEIEISTDHSLFEDQVRGLVTLFQSDMPHTEALANHLIQPSSKGKRYNFLRRIAESPVKIEASLSPSQNEVLKSFESVSERIMNIKSTFGSGKSYFALQTTAAFLAADPLPDDDDITKTRPNVAMFLCPNNKGVDDSLLEFVKISEQHGLDFEPIRLHALGGEKGAALSNFLQVGDHNECITTNDIDVDVFHAHALIFDLQKKFMDKQKKGDPRRVLEQYSLSTAMLKRMHKDAKYSSLRLYLQTDKSTASKEDREEIQKEVYALMEDTLRNCRALFGTPASAAKFEVNLWFDPTMITIDEVYRLTEPAWLAAVVHYRPHIIIHTGDDHQMMPTVKTLSSTPYLAKGLKASVNLNCFAPQLLLALPSRLEKAGHGFSTMIVQHRCHGGLFRFPSEQFYDGQVIDGTAVQSLREDGTTTYSLHPKCQLMRDHFKKYVSPGYASQNSNRLLINIPYSQAYNPKGSKSIVNQDHISIGMNHIKQMLADPTLADLKITVISLYKAQALAWDDALAELNPSQRRRVSVDNRTLPSRTVDGAQGYTGEIIFLDFVRSRGVGFSGEKHRLNVALTRAQFALVILMNVEGMFPSLIEKLRRRDKRWPKLPSASKHLQALVKDCYEHRDWKTVTVDTTKCSKCQSTKHRAKDCDVTICLRCKGTGHKARECPNYCHNCGEDDHGKQSCPSNLCHKCLHWGHLATNCMSRPDPKQHICYVCCEIGHSSKECTVVGLARLKLQRDTSYKKKLEDVKKLANDNHKRRIQLMEKAGPGSSIPKDSELEELADKVNGSNGSQAPAGGNIGGSNNIKASTGGDNIWASILGAQGSNDGDNVRASGRSTEEDSGNAGGSGDLGATEGSTTDL